MRDLDDVMMRVVNIIIVLLTTYDIIIFMLYIPDIIEMVIGATLQAATTAISVNYRILML